MSEVLTTTIVHDVKVAIDEIADNDSELEVSGQDDSEMSEIIESKIVDALRFVYINADASLLEPDVVVSNSDGNVDIVDHVGKVTLPDKYLRLVFAKFASWSRFLGYNDIIPWDSPEYAMLKNKHTTGTPERPKVAQSWNGKSKMLELYAGKDNVCDIVTLFKGKSNYILVDDANARKSNTVNFDSIVDGDIQVSDVSPVFTNETSLCYSTNKKLFVVLEPTESMVQQRKYCISYTLKDGSTNWDFNDGVDNARTDKFFMSATHVVSGSSTPKAHKVAKVGDGWYVYTTEASGATDKMCVVYNNAGVYEMRTYDISDFDIEEARQVVHEDTISVGYMTEPWKIVKKGGAAFRIPDGIYRAVIYYIAGLTMVTYRDQSSAQMFFQEANDLMGLTQSIKAPEQ